ncbi:DUF6053 domain-containing protein [Lysobacter capsici]|uniref:DUF6053 domain-containing protein n=1 Tax=Lysobacter capsici TaxID=435897 RepID=UPI003D2F8760
MRGCGFALGSGWAGAGLSAGFAAIGAKGVGLESPPTTALPQQPSSASRSFVGGLSSPMLLYQPRRNPLQSPQKLAAASTPRRASEQNHRGNRSHTATAAATATISGTPPPSPRVRSTRGHCCSWPRCPSAHRCR